MRTKKIFLNMICDILPYLLIGVVGIIKMDVLIKYIGDVGNGYYQTINQIISYVFLAQAGFSDAVIYSLYKPFAEKNKDDINAIYGGARKVFRIIGFIILGIIFLVTLGLHLFYNFEEGYKVSGIGCTPICYDENCAFCSSHTSCISCNNGYVLENNICVPCNDQNCQICSSKEVSMCNNCKYGFLLYEGVCAEKCNLISNCDYCLNNKCVACKNGCVLKEGKCSCFNSFLVISLVVVCIIIIGIGVFCYIGISRKKRQDQLNNMAQGINMVNIVSNRGEIVEPSSEKMKEKYEEEFTDNRVLTEENEYGLCDFCNYKAAKYIADCGCQLCKDHSKPIKDDDDAENIKKCPVCMKVVYKVHPKKFKCGICLEDKIHLAKFKCHCALTVCKDCYIKCKMTNGKCPACRKKIL